MGKDTNKKLDYNDAVNYHNADPAKVLAQKEALATAGNMPFGFKELTGTRGESAYVFDMGEMYGALVQEGLGTKSLIAQSIYKDTGELNFAAIAKDTVATVINDLISVGATPVALNAYWTSSSYDWLTDNKLTTDFIKGWRAACDEAEVTWGGGETQSLKGVIQEDVLEFAGCGFGVIKDKKNLVSDQNVQTGDAIVFIESSGVHANGIGLTREIATNLPDGYATVMPDGKSFGEALLAPTILYNKVLKAIRDEGVQVHYLSNITGHGWRKIMRGTKQVSYVIDFVPEPQPVFDFIQEHSKNTTEEMYGNYNMGAGYAIFLSKDDAEKVVDIAKKQGLKAWVAGEVKEGDKCVDIKPLNIKFESDSLGVR